MSKNDPELFSSDIEWYLTAREAALGIRSSLSSQVAQIEGLVTVSGSSDRFHDAAVMRVDAVQRDRRIRPLWAALGSFDRDVLGAYYTGSAKAETPVGYRRFPRGAEAKLGTRMAGVCFYVASLAGTTRQLVAACETGSIEKLAPWAEEAERLVREAHRAFYELVDDGAEVDDDEPGIASGAFASEMSSWESPAARQRGGVWRAA